MAILDERQWRLACLDDSEAAYRRYITDAGPEAAYIDEAFVRLDAKFKLGKVPHDDFLERKIKVVCHQRGVQYSCKEMEHVVGLELGNGYCKGVVLSGNGYEAASLDYHDAEQLVETIKRVVKSLEDLQESCITSVSLALPALADRAEIKAAIDACQKAELDVVSMSYCPVLAAMAIAWLRNRQHLSKRIDRRIAIGDFGCVERGVALIELASVDNECQCEVLAVIGEKNAVGSVVSVRREETIGVLVERCIRALAAAVDAAGCRFSDLDSICLIGELAVIPQVRAELESFSGVKAEFYCGQEYLAAIGAAIQGGVRQGCVRDLLLLDAYPFCLEIALAGGGIDQLYSPNCLIPIYSTGKYRVAPNEDRATTVQLFEVSWSRGTRVLLANIDVTDLTFSESNADAEILVRVDIDVHRCFEIVVKDLLSLRETWHRIDKGEAAESCQRRYPLPSHLLKDDCVTL